VALTAEVARLPLVPAKAEWVNAFRVPVVMDTGKAREELGWEPEYDAQDVLDQTVAAARARGLL
jgi:nucleoside-diphosphate-sugar epimerase